MSATSSSNLSTPSRAPRSIFTSNLFLFRSITDEVPARAARGCTVVHKVSHSSGLEHAKREVETSGPTLIIVVLEQTVNTAQWHFNYAKTDVEISSAYIAQCYVQR